MAKVTITQLPALSTVHDADVLPIVDVGADATKKVTSAALKSYITNGISTYGNANVANYLPTYTGNLHSLTGNVTTTANISGAYILGNGSLLTGLPATYGNANVANYLPTYTGNLVSLTGNIITTANLTANVVKANSITTSGGSGNITGVNYITANVFVGDGGQLTGITKIGNATSNITVTNTGTITANLASKLALNITSNQVALGVSAGEFSQSVQSIAIGYQAGFDSQSVNSVAIGYQAARAVQGSGAVAIGGEAGRQDQGIYGIAIGQNAGRTLQGTGAIAIGIVAGYTNQLQGAIAIGAEAGGNTQGKNSIAIGQGAGGNLNIDKQANNSIIINATGSYLLGNTTGLFVAPIRNSNTANVLYYDTVTKEISYGPASSGNVVASTGSYYVAKNGNDTTGTGSVVNPFLTISKAIAVGGNRSQIMINPGDYTENITIANITSLTLSATGSGATDIYGNFVVSGSSTGLDFYGLGIHGNLIYSATGTSYFRVVNVGTTGIPTVVTKSGTGYLEFIGSDLQSGAGATKVDVTGAGQLVFTDTKVWNLNVANDQASVTVFSSPGIANTTLTRGTLSMFQSVAFSFVNGGNAIVSNGGTLNLKNTGIVNPNLTPGKINLTANTVLVCDDVNFDRANSSIGYSANTIADFQSIRTDYIDLRSNSIALGTNAVASGANSISIGRSAVSSGANVITINADGTALTTTQSNAFYVSPIRNDNANTSTPMYYNATTKEVTYGTGAVVVSTDYLVGTLSGDQTLVSPGAIIRFNTVKASANISGGLSLNTSTGTITLPANKTFKLTCLLQIRDFSTSEATAFNWWNITAGNWLTGNTGAGYYLPVNASTNQASQPVFETIFRTTATTNVEVRCQGGNPIVTVGGFYSNFNIVQIA